MERLSTLRKRLISLHNKVKDRGAELAEMSLLVRGAPAEKKVSNGTLIPEIAQKQIQFIALAQENLPVSAELSMRPIW